MKKRLLTLSFLAICLTGYSQLLTKNNYDVYGTSLKFQKDFTSLNYWANPSMPEMYILVAVTSVDPVIYIPSGIGPIRINFDTKPPQVRLLHIKNGVVNPVWDWITGPITPEGFTAQSFQQWECYWDPTIKNFVNVMGINPYRFYEKNVERLDPTFHSVGGNNVNDAHGTAYFIDNTDTLFLSEESSGKFSYIKCVDARTGDNRGTFVTQPGDTIQSKVDQLTCLDNRFLGTTEKEYYHTNSVDNIHWNLDTFLWADSERHPNLIRFVWAIKNPDKTFRTVETFRLGSCTDSFNQISVRNGCFNIEAGHDFKFIKKFGDSIVCSYYDNHSCSGGSKSMLFTLYPLTKEVVLLDSIRPTGDKELSSQGLGSSRKILGSDMSYGAIKSALTIVNWNGNRSGFDTMRLFFPPLVIDTLLLVPKTIPLNESGDINIYAGDENHTQMFGIKFGYIPDNMADRLSGKTQIGVTYRANAYLPGQILFPNQPQIFCRSISTDSVELYTIGINVEMWNTGDTTSTIRVSKNYPDKKYLVRGKTDATMRGLLYSKPFTLRNDGCVNTGVIETKSVHSEINIFPNPSSGVVNFSTSEEIQEVAVYDLKGQIISASSRPSTYIDMRFVERGTYLFVFTTRNGENITKKVILQ